MDGVDGWSGWMEGWNGMGWDGGAGGEDGNERLGFSESIEGTEESCSAHGWYVSSSKENMEEGKPERYRCGGSRDTAYALLIQAYNTLSPDQAPAGRWQVMKGVGGGQPHSGGSAAELSVARFRCASSQSRWILGSPFPSIHISVGCHPWALWPCTPLLLSI